MTVARPAKPQLRPFYTTAEQRCPYLPGRLERRIVTFLGPGGDDPAQDDLALVGFRRSQNVLYRPACHGCNACVPVRIVVADFVPGRAWRKILNRNADLVATERPAEATAEQYELFVRYLSGRHADGGMAGMGFDEYAEMVGGWTPGTLLVEFRDPAGALVAVSLTDRLATGLSGVYKFYEPQQERRSLGTMVVLWHVRRASELGLPYVYLGYWIGESRKMAYKSRFQPLERLGAEGWERMTDPGDEATATG